MSINNSNTTVLAKPNHTTSLASAGILVNVRMTTTTLSVSNKDVSEEICAQKKADSDTGNFVHKLIGKNPHHQAIMTYRSTLDNWVKNLGYEWGGSWFVIPFMLYPRFQSEFAAHEAEFNRRVDAFIAEYPTILSNIAFKQGDLFDRSKYPDTSDLRSRFSLTIRTMPVPENDWRVQVSEDQAKDLHNHYARQHQTILSEIRVAQTDKLVEFMQRIAKACTVEADAEGKVKRGRLYATTIEQTLELCDTIAGFNPTGDAVLEQARTELANLLRERGPALTTSDSLRTATKQDIDNILSKFGK